MSEILKTVLLLSAFGSAIIILLSALKPFTFKHFSARWQYYVWLAAMICMLVPFWKIVPRSGAEKIAPNVGVTRAYPAQSGTDTNTDADTQSPPAVTDREPIEYREIPIGAKNRIRVYDLALYAYLTGVGVFILLAFGNYFVFLFKMRRDSVDLAHSGAFEEVKRSLKIRRNIRIRLSSRSLSPMLVGTFFPVIYLPKTTADGDAEKMIFAHELTHYKHGDLIYKQIALIVNAIHWFNPFAYLMSANVSQACEVYCDMTVVKDMDEADKTMYMETILDMLDKGGM